MSGSRPIKLFEVWDVYVPPKQRPVKVGPASRGHCRWVKERGPVRVNEGRKICRSYHSTNRDACMAPHNPFIAIGQTVLL